MVDPIQPSPLPQFTIPLTATAAASPTTVYTVYKAIKRVMIAKITLSNVDTTTAEQVWVGARLESGTGTSDWEPLIAPILAAGEVFEWEGELYLSAGDEIVGYGAAGALVNATIEVGKV